MKRPAKVASPVPNHAFLTDTLDTSGAELLHEVGTATSPSSAATPLSPTYGWALIRYYWAFDQAIDDLLCLSPMGAALKYHHRQAISEFIGIGAGLLLAREVLRVRYQGKPVTVIDAEQALANPDLVAGVQGASTLRPDYFASVEDGPLVVIECKGASGNSGRIAALAKAMRQVNSVTHWDSVPSTLAIHTVARRTGIDSLVLGSVGDEVWSCAAKPDAPRGNPVRRVDDTRVEIIDPGSFRADIDDLAQAAALSWAGNEEASTGLLPERVRLARGVERRDNSPQIAIRIQDRTYEGVEASMPLGGQTLTFFRGIDQRYKELLVTKSVGNRNEATLQELHAEMARQHRSELERRRAGDPDADEVVAAGENGTVSRLTVR